MSLDVRERQPQANSPAGTAPRAAELPLNIQPLLNNPPASRPTGPAAPDAANRLFNHLADGPEVTRPANATAPAANAALVRSLSERNSLAGRPFSSIPRHAGITRPICSMPRNLTKATFAGEWAAPAQGGATPGPSQHDAPETVKLVLRPSLPPGGARSVKMPA